VRSVSDGVTRASAIGLFLLVVGIQRRKLRFIRPGGLIPGIL
jgi:hypothetical protein